MKQLTRPNRVALLRRLDLSTIAGLAVALAGILGGLILEGGKFSDIGQFTAAVIVAGGTIGAVLVTTPWRLFWAAVKKLPSVFWHQPESADSAITEIVSLALRARKSGLVPLEKEVEAIADPFLRKALSLAVDGAGVRDIRQIMDLEICLAEQRGDAEAKVFEAAGGYAPTIGIIGAVLGLIQVMKHLDDIEALGHGIAVAFVATVYGVAAANILLLPVAQKLKLRLRQSLEMKEMMLEGVIAIAEGINPLLIRSRLEAYQQEETTKSRKKEAAPTNAPKARVASIR